MLVTLKSPELTVVIEDTGAQLASVRSARGTEYLWQGDPAVWPRRAPLLFPVIARLRNGQYTLEGKTYTIPTHGFCRDAPFTVQDRGPAQVTFRCADTPQTRKVYPFAFVLTVTYTLEGHCLTKTHRVENHSGRIMYYELGGHDGFRAPLEPGEVMDDYAVRIPGLESARPYEMDEDKMLAPKAHSFPLPKGRLPLRPSAWDLDTIILDELPQRQAALVDKTGRPRVTLEFPDFPYLGIWTAAKDFDTKYVCIEPWTSLPDAIFSGRGLPDKTGVRSLLPGQSEILTYTTQFT